MVSGCTSLYPVVRGDGCWAIANDHVISLVDLHAWNPALNGDCSGLFPTYCVCVSRNTISTNAPGATSTVPDTSSTTTRAQQAVSSTISHKVPRGLSLCLRLHQSVRTQLAAVQEVTPALVQHLVTAVRRAASAETPQRTVVRVARERLATATLAMNRSAQMAHAEVL